MIIDRAVGILSKREAIGAPGLPRNITHKIGDIAVSLGAWFDPGCYQRQCKYLQERVGITQEGREDIVAGIGQIVMGTVQGNLKVDLRNLRKVIEEVRPNLGDVDYDDKFDKTTAEVIEKLAPLHDENE